MSASAPIRGLAANEVVLVDGQAGLDRRPGLRFLQACIGLEVNPLQAGHRGIEDGGGRHPVERGDAETVAADPIGDHRAGNVNPFGDLGNTLSLGTHGTNDGNQRGSAIGIIFELSHVGGGVWVNQFVLKFWYRARAGLFRLSRGNPPKTSVKRAESFPPRSRLFQKTSPVLVNR